MTIALDDGVDEDTGDQGDQTPSDDPTIHVRFSASEVLRRKDFARYTSAELDEARRLMADLRLIGAPPAAAARPLPTRRGRPDLRRTVRAALRAGGEPCAGGTRKPGERPRRLVLLLDVSGSMEPYAAALVRFVHAAVVGRAVGSRPSRSAPGSRASRAS